MKQFVLSAWSLVVSMIAGGAASRPQRSLPIDATVCARRKHPTFYSTLFNTTMGGQRQVRDPECVDGSRRGTLRPQCYSRFGSGIAGTARYSISAVALTRRSLLGLFAAGPLVKADSPARDSILRYWSSLARPDGGYAWPDEPNSALSVTYSAVTSFRALGVQVPHAAAIARFVRNGYPMPPQRRKDRPLHRFDYEQMQTLVWLGESIEEYRPEVAGWVKPSYFTKTYELHENPILQQETGAILCRRLLGLGATGEWREYVLARRRKNGSFNHTPATDGTDGHVTNTLWGLLACDALGIEVDRAKTADWIRSCSLTYAPAPAIAPVDHVDYVRASVLGLKHLGDQPANGGRLREYLVSLWNADGGFGDSPGRASNPQATQQALEALAGLGSMQLLEAARPHARPRAEVLPKNLKICTMQIEAPGVGSPREAAEMGAALKIDLWGAKNCAPGWINRAQAVARGVTFFPANEEYGTYVDVPGLGTYSHLADVTAPPGVDFGPALSDKGQQPNAWQSFLDKRIGPLRRAGGSNVWQFNENEELTRVLLNQAVAEGTFSSISAFHFGSENFLRSQPFLNRYRDVLPFIGLQDAHTQTWWWMEFLVAFRTFFLAEQPTWAGWQNALRKKWIVSVRHDAKTDFQTEVAGASHVVRAFVMDRQAEWKWWGDKPDQLIRPVASLVDVRAGDPFEEAQPHEGVNLRLRCWMDTQPFGVPKIPVYEFVSLEVDNSAVKASEVRVEPKGPERGDVYHVANVSTPGKHRAVATVRHVKTGETRKITREFSV